MAILDEARRRASVYDGNWTAGWLLSGLHEHTWRISKGAETRIVDGKWVGAYRFHWGVGLPNGTRLTDPSNRAFLRGLQKLGFLAREMPGGPNTFSSHLVFLYGLSIIARWAYLHEDLLNPRQAMLTRVTKATLNDYFLDLADGGIAFLLQYPRRFLQAVYRQVLARDPSPAEMQDPFALDEEARTQIAAWLDAAGYLKPVGRDDPHRYVDRTVVAELIHADESTTKQNQRWAAFLSQFVPDTDAPKASEGRDEEARRAVRSRKEYPSQRMLMLADAKAMHASGHTMQRHLYVWQTLFSVHRHLPEFGPDPAAFQPKELHRIIHTASAGMKHTPWVPLTTALRYTTEALRWVHVYGEDLVSSFLDAYRALHQQGLLVSAPQPACANPSLSDRTVMGRQFAQRRDDFVAALPLPASLQPLKIRGWGSYLNVAGKAAFSRLRNAPSLQDAIMVLVGAITIVLGVLKPIRESELRNLRRDCVLFVEGDGYWASHDLRKKNVGDVRPEAARPIPRIAARAILLLRRLSDGLKTILGVTDAVLRDSLFALPLFGPYEAEINKILEGEDLNNILDAFCDYVAIDPDTHGRRWYLRVHEMRKSFLIVFFWTYRYASLDAARWMAGHADAVQIYAYIEANFPGQELPGLEAEYTSRVLRDYQDTGDPRETESVEELHQQVCHHFNVTDLSWLEEDTLREWLEHQFETRAFEIRPYSIRSDDGRLHTRIAFRIRALEDTAS